MTASTRPQARLQPNAVTNNVSISSLPDSATDTAPTKLRAMSRPKSSSETRSTGLSTGSDGTSAAEVVSVIAFLSVQE